MTVVPHRAATVSVPQGQQSAEAVLSARGLHVTVNVL